MNNNIDLVQRINELEELIRAAHNNQKEELDSIKTSLKTMI